MLSKNKVVSAMALVRAASGKSIDATGPIKAENLADHAPDPGVAAAAAGILREAGMEVGPLVGIAFSVTGSVETFERLLGARLRESPGGQLQFALAGKRYVEELRGADLPEPLRPLLAAIAFARPPDFGPTDFH